MDPGWVWLGKKMDQLEESTSEFCSVRLVYWHQFSFTFIFSLKECKLKLFSFFFGVREEFIIQTVLTIETLPNLEFFPQILSGD